MQSCAETSAQGDRVTGLITRDGEVAVFERRSDAGQYYPDPHDQSEKIGGRDFAHSTVRGRYVGGAAGESRVRKRKLLTNVRVMISRYRRGVSGKFADVGN